jgi:hypothetical protein
MSYVYVDFCTSTLIALLLNLIVNGYDEGNVISLVCIHLLQKIEYI